MQSAGCVSVVADIPGKIIGLQRGIFEVQLEQFVPLALYNCPRRDSSTLDWMGREALRDFISRKQDWDSVGRMQVKAI